MSETIKNGAIGVLSAVGGAIATFALIMLTTGSYKQKIDTTVVAVEKQEVRINELYGEISGMKREVSGNSRMLTEVRGDVKELLKRTE